MPEILTIANLWYTGSKVWACAESEFRFYWMKLGSKCNHYTTMPLLSQKSKYSQHQLFLHFQYGMGTNFTWMKITFFQKKVLRSHNYVQYWNWRKCKAKKILKQPKVISLTFLCYQIILKAPNFKSGFHLTFQKWFASFPKENNRKTELRCRPTRPSWFCDRKFLILDLTVKLPEDFNEKENL